MNIKNCKLYIIFILFSLFFINTYSVDCNELYASNSDIIFCDDFEGKDFLSTNSDGFRWEDLNKASIVTQDPINGPTAVNNGAPINNAPGSVMGDDGSLREWTAKNGDYSMRISHAANSEWSEIRYDLGKGYPDLWVSYWIRVPHNYYHYNSDPDQSNNKWFVAYMGENNHPIDYQDSDVSRLAVESWNSGGGKASLASGFRNSGGRLSINSIGDYDNFLDPVDRGRWMHIVYELDSSSTETTTDGNINIYRKWEDETEYELINSIYDSNVNIHSSAGRPGWGAGYIMGYANDYYQYRTDWLIDDVIFSTSSLLNIDDTSSSSDDENTFWVSKQGNNNNDCSTEELSCLSIDRAAEFAINPGNIVNVKEGVYYENTGGYVWNEPQEIGIRVRGSGTADNPIIFQAAPGDEGKVVIDQNGINDNLPGQTGFYINNNDYIIIRNFEIRDASGFGILNVGPRTIPIDLDAVSEGVEISGNYIHNIVSQIVNANPGGIRADGAYKWTIKNNKIGFVANGGYLLRDGNAAAINSYVLVDSLIENNELYESGSGVKFKDHTENTQGEPLGTIVKNNFVHDTYHGFYISSGDQTGKAGNNIIKNNIISNIDSTGVTAYYTPAGSTNLQIEHNLFYGVSITGIGSARYYNVSSLGNIFIGNNPYRLFHASSIPTIGLLSYSDYNLFDSIDMKVNMNDGNTGNYNQYSSLSSWQSIIPSDHTTISDLNPDLNSIYDTNLDSYFINPSNNDFTYTSNSPAIDFMPDGSNAGPYRNGNEIIGLLPSHFLNGGGVDPPSDNTNPDPATNLVTSSITETSFTLNWNPGDDENGISGYDIYINGNYDSSSTITSKYISGLSAGINYNVYVRAKDPSGNYANSNIIQVTTSEESTGTDDTDTFWVTKSGNDNNDCSTIALACKTIQRGVHVLNAGDTLNVKAGTYFENGYYPDGTVSNWFEHTAGIALYKSGTRENPIIIQAAPGDEGTVIIDQKRQFTGFNFDDIYSQAPFPDFIHIKNFIFKNCRHSCITSQNGFGDYSDDDTKVTRGVLIEGNTFEGAIINKKGVNSGTIRIDSSREWIIRNNLIYGSKYTNSTGWDDLNSPDYENPNYLLDPQGMGAIYGYSIYDTVVENNDIRDGYSAIYWKDTANNNPGYPIVQSIVRNNKVTDVQRFIYMNAGGSETNSPGYHIIKNNIIDNVNVIVYMCCLRQEGRIDFSNNFINFKNAGILGGSIEGIASFGTDESLTIIEKHIESIGNIFHKPSGISGVTLNIADRPVNIHDFNYNIYTYSPEFKFRFNSQLEATYNTVSSWRNANHPQLFDDNQGEFSHDNIDINTLANDININDYTLPSNSIARNMMPDGSNAGPYQNGNEIIGLLPSHFLNGGGVDPPIDPPIDPPTDNTPPSPAPVLKLDLKSTNSISLSWTQSSDTESSPVTYRVYKDGNLETTISSLTYTFNNLIDDNEYTFKIDAIDTKGNSISSNSLLVSTNEIITTPGEYTVTINPTEDTYLNQDNINNNDLAYLNTYTWGDYNVANVILLRFDLSEIPTEANIKSSTLELFQFESGREDSLYDISAYRIINNNPIFSEVSGNEYSLGNPWSAVSGRTSPLALGDISSPSDTSTLNLIDNEYKSWDILDIVSYWYTNPNENYGLLLDSDASSVKDNFRSFRSIDHIDSSQWPKLTITFDIDDSSVDPVCGNNIKELNEVCDEGTNPNQNCEYGQNNCQVCTGSCTYTSGNVIGYCGDGIVQSTDGEDCDGAIGLLMCSEVNLGYDLGDVTCTSTCSYDYISCSSTGPDDKAPMISNILPTEGNLAVGTTSVITSFTTLQSATCKYSSNRTFDYETDGTPFNDYISIHNTTLNNLTIGNYKYYIKCEDLAGNINSDDEANFITFSIPELVVTPPDNGGDTGGKSRGGGSSRSSDKPSLIDSSKDVCVPDYNAKPWSTCLNGEQRRLVLDDNSCVDEKTETRKCSFKNTEIENKFLNAKKLDVQKSETKKRTYNTQLTASYNEIFKTDKKLDDESFVLVDGESGEEYLGKLVEENNGEFFYSLERIDESNLADLKFEGLVPQTISENVDSGFRSLFGSPTFIIIVSVVSILLMLGFIIYLVVYIRKIHE